MNLFTDQWITAIHHNGTTATVSAQDAITQGREYYGIYEQSPACEYGIYQFLACLAMDMVQPQSPAAIAKVLQAGFPTDYEHIADLDMTTFMQTMDGYPAAGADKSTAELFLECPGSTSTTHFYHRYEDEHRICLPCAAAGILRFPAFTTLGGVGYGYSVIRGTGYRLVPRAANLHEVLALMLTPLRHFDLPSWRMESSSGDRTVGPVGLMRWLSFMPRRIKLWIEAGSTTCTRCGQPALESVARLSFAAGTRTTLETYDAQRDPYSVYVNNATLLGIREAAEGYLRTVLEERTVGKFDVQFPAFMEHPQCLGATVYGVRSHQAKILDIVQFTV